ncbi:hypothetical protein AYO42_00940 [Rhizomicrobium sp. SCGC AG-212-E05]|nr:hypothetical protein AYO42_00940 [Rhizomicrobium sp. SCGC AG-212-E05]
MRAQLVAIASAAGTIAAIVGVTGLVAANATTLDGSVVIPGFLDIAFHHNRGISFGLFAQDTEMGSRVLILFISLLIAVLAVLVYRTSRTITAVGLGMVIGGGLANIVDRAIDGAVFDFLVVHLGSQPLFVCNAPDIAISVGFLLWLWDDFVSERPSEASQA